MSGPDRTSALHSLYLILVLFMLPGNASSQAEGLSLQQLQKNTNPDLLYHYFEKTMFGEENGISGPDNIFKFSSPVRYVILIEQQYTGNSSKFKRTVRSTISKIEKYSGIVFDYHFDKETFTDVTIRISSPSEFEYLLNHAITNNNSTMNIENTKCFVRFSTLKSGNFGSLVVIPDNLNFREFEECADEEIAQALGPAHDHDSLQHSMFNDSNDLNQLTAMDYCILRILYREEFYPRQPKREAMTKLRHLIDEYGWKLCES